MRHLHKDLIMLEMRYENSEEKLKDYESNRKKYIMINSLLSLLKNVDEHIETLIERKAFSVGIVENCEASWFNYSMETPIQYIKHLLEVFLLQKLSLIKLG